MIVVDPRFTRTAAHADEYVRFRSGTDIAVIWGMLHHIFKQRLGRQAVHRERVYGMDKIRAEVLTKWTPEEVEQVTGVPGPTGVRRSPRPWPRSGRRRSSGAWGDPAHRRHRQRARLLHPAAGDRQCRRVRRRRKHLPRPRQRAGRDRSRPDIRTRCRATTASSRARGSTGRGSGKSTTSGSKAAATPRKAMMEKPGIPSSRWFDGVLEKNDTIDQNGNLRAMVVLGPRAQHPDARHWR